MDYNISRSHNIFFNYLTCKKVNELLKRADNIPGLDESILSNDIQPKLPPEYNVETKVKYDLDNQVNIYITFLKNKNEIGHVTLHLTKENKVFTKQLKKTSKTNTPGRLHGVNTRGIKSRHIIEVTNIGDRFTLEVRHRPDVIEKGLKRCIDTTIGVIEEYFNKQNVSLYIGKERTYSGEHKYFKKVRNNLRSSSTPLKKTRKVGNTKIEYCDLIN